MTAPTSDERREVAEQLREARPSTYYAEELVELIEDALLPAFPTETWREPTDVLASLADLIDPTCEMVVKNGRTYCGKCGRMLECEIEDDCYKLTPFCPGCGVRVVADDGK